MASRSKHAADLALQRCRAGTVLASLVAMNARDAMTPTPVTLRSDETLGAAIERFATLGVRHLPIVDDSHQLIGVLSERDVLGCLPLPGASLELIEETFRRPIREVMTTDVIAAELDTALVDVVDALIARRVGAVPVIDGARAVVGIVSYVDALRVLRDQLRESAPERHG